jgi:integrase
MPRRLRCMVLIAGFGNLPLSELLGLERRHVNPRQRKISVRQGEHQLSKGQLVVTEPKSDAGRRTFNLPASLMEELTDHMDKFTEPEPTARVFTGERKGRSVDTSSRSIGTAHGLRSIRLRGSFFTISVIQLRPSVGGPEQRSPT